MWNPSYFFEEKIYGTGLYVGEEFLSCVVAKAKETSIYPAFKCVPLPRNMSDIEIEKMLGGTHFFTETEVCVLITGLIYKQVGGKNDELITGGGANLFYLSSCVVTVCEERMKYDWEVSKRGVVAARRQDGLAANATRVFVPSTGA